MAIQSPPIQEKVSGFIQDKPTWLFPQVWLRWLQNIATLLNNVEILANYAVAGLGTGMVDPENDIIFSINASDATKFDYTAGTIRFADAYTDPNSDPVVITLEIAAAIGVSVTNIATQSATFIYFDTTGVIIQESSLQGGAYLRDHVGGTILIHSTASAIDSSSGFTPHSLINTNMSFTDLSFCQGNINCNVGGVNKITGAAGTTKINKAQGCWYYHSINARMDNKSPNIIDTPALIAQPFLEGWTVTDNTSGKLVTTTIGIVAGVYDDGTAVFSDALPQGTLTANRWVNNRVFIAVDSNTLIVQYGTATYTSLALARAAVAAEDFLPIPVLAGTTPIATITMRGGATDLTLAADAEIRQAIPPRATFQ